MKVFEGYRIFKNLDTFYKWQGKTTKIKDSKKDTVNNLLGYGTDNSSGTLRYTYPVPHPSAVSDLDINKEPKTITGNDVRVCALMDSNCPKSMKVKEQYKTLEEVQAEGWYKNINDDDIS